MNFEIIELVINSMDTVLSLIFVIFAIILTIGILVHYVRHWALIISAAIIATVLSGYLYWNLFLLPKYQEQTQVWQAEQDKKAAEEKVANAPWKEISYPAKILTVNHGYSSIFFETFEVVEFMDNKGHVYDRAISTREGPWRQTQMAFHHHLLQLKENGNEITITYKTKGEIDPSGKRIIVKIETEDKTEPVWSETLIRPK